MRNLSTIISKETCLFYGLPGTAILAVSLILSCKVGNDFGGSTFVNTVSFLGCNVLLWLLYLVLFQYLPVDLMKIWLLRKNPVSIEAANTSTVLGAIEHPVSTVKPMATEEYKAHCAEFERKKREEHQNLVNPIIDYVGRVMAPFMEENELNLLRNEIRVWCDIRSNRYFPKHPCRSSCHRSLCLPLEFHSHLILSESHSHTQSVSFQCLQ